MTYLNFVKETQRRLGDSTALTIDILEQYGSMMLVEWKLRQLVETGSLSEENYRYLMGRYSEVSGAAADFETFFVLLSPFLGNTQPTSGYGGTSSCWRVRIRQAYARDAF